MQKCIFINKQVNALASLPEIMKHESWILEGTRQLADRVLYNKILPMTTIGKESVI